ncbi:4512_t:CDS:2, partial [Acaulospora morrowiae]
KSLTAPGSRIDLEEFSKGAEFHPPNLYSRMIFAQGRFSSSIKLSTCLKGTFKVCMRSMEIGGGEWMKDTLPCLPLIRSLLLWDEFHLDPKKSYVVPWVNEFFVVLFLYTLEISRIKKSTFMYHVESTVDSGRLTLDVHSLYAVDNRDDLQDPE